MVEVVIQLRLFPGIHNLSDKYERPPPPPDPPDFPTVSSAKEFWGERER